MKVKLLLVFLAGAIVASLFWAAVVINYKSKMRMYKQDYSYTHKQAKELTDINLITNKTWFLTSTDGVASYLLATIELKPDGSASGFSGCNNFSGNYKFENSKLSFDPIVTTLMACDNSEIEGKFINVLNTVSKVALIKDQLMIASDTNELLFSDNPNIASGLVGKWGFAGMNINGQASTAIEGSDTNISLDLDGKINGIACNRFGGTYILSEGNKLTISDLISTKMACTEPADIMLQESNLINNLPKATAFVIDESVLRIMFDTNSYLEFNKAVD